MSEQFKSLHSWIKVFQLVEATLHTMWPNACFQKRKHLLYINNQSDYTKEEKSKSNCQMHWTKPFCTFSFTVVPRNPHLNSTLFSGAVIPYKFVRNCKRESSFTCSLLPLESNGAASTTSRTLCPSREGVLLNGGKSYIYLRTTHFPDGNKQQSEPL